MKKIKYISALFVTAFIGLTNTFAASSSISAPKQVEVGHSVKATVTINAAAWDIKVNGTGNTNGCSTHDADASSSGKNIKKSISVSCTANSTGVIKVTYKGDITDADGSTKDVSGSAVINVVAARPKSTNNYLKSLSIEGLTISPEFNKDTLEYTAIAEPGTEKINLIAEKADGYASIVGPGEKDVVEGDNRFEIVVTSETGSSKTYVVTLTVKEFSPITVSINGKTYTVVRKAQDLTKPENFNETTVNIGEDIIPAFVNETINKTLVGLKDQDGKITLFEYKDGKYIKYIEISDSNLVINVEKMDESLLPKDYKKYKAIINDLEVDVYKYNKSSNFALVYGLDVSTGKKALYQVDLKNNTIQLFNFESTDKLTKNNKDSLLIFMIAGGVIFVEFLIILLQRKKNKRILNKIKDEKIAKMKKVAIKDSKKESIDKKDLKTEEIKLESSSADIIDEDKSKKKSK